jgi:hypothetical protein
MTENSVPKGDSKEAVAFLRDFCGDENRVIQSIHPETRVIRAYTFTKGEDDKLLATIERLQGVENVYFQVNPLKAPINGARKATKTDVREIKWLQVDKDPVVKRDRDEERARIFKALSEFRIKPNLIIDSGGGGQAFWRLATPIILEPRADGQEPWVEGEACSQQLALELSADPCFNCDRIMRLPFTTNMPDAKKRAKGRVPALASVIYRDEGSFPLSAFAKATPAKVGQIAGTSQSASSARDVKLSDNIKRLTIDEVQQIAAERGHPLRDDTCMLIVQGHDPDRPEYYKDRSKAVFRVSIEMVKAGLTPDEIAAVITDPSFGISAHVLDQKRPMKYAARQIKRATEKVKTEFDTLKNEKPDPRSRKNIQIALNKLGIDVSLNEHQNRPYIDGLEDFDGEINDKSMNRLYFSLQENFGFLPSRQFFEMALHDIGALNAFHPIKDYINGLRWDGVSRLDGWLSHYMGAERSPLNDAIGSIVLIAAIRRIREPGCKFDEILVLQGEQGTGKSSAISILAVNPEWFSDTSPLGLDTRQTLEHILGFWLIEISELTGFGKRNVEELKATLSRQTDRGRLPWAHSPIEVKRQCIFIGTTNSDAFLEDTTGNRRFWIVKVGEIDLDALSRDRDQLWAEAAAREANGESIRLPRELYQAAAEVQELFSLGDMFVDELRSAFADVEGWVASTDVRRVLQQPNGQFNDREEKRMGRAMRKIGFTRSRKRFDGGNSHYYWRGNQDERIHVKIDAETGSKFAFHKTVDDDPF